LADTCPTCGGPLARDWSAHNPSVHEPHRSDDCIAHLKGLIKSGPDYAGGRIIVANSDRIIARYWLKDGVRRGEDAWEFDADAGLPAERLVLKLELARKKAKR